MTIKGSFKLQPSNYKQDNYLSSGIVSTVLGVTLLFSYVNVRHAVNSFQKQQLIPTTAEVFASEKYFPIQPGDSVKLARQDFSEIDFIAQKLNYSGSSVTELAELLSRNAVTESDKARIIYAWITQHITYDIAAYNEAIANDKYPDVSPTKVLRDRTTICSGYSNLYQALAERMGLDGAIVIGYAKGATPPEDPRFKNVNHSWNSIKIDGDWYLLDATFGAGSIESGRFVANYKPYYFATPPQQFFNLHYPKDSGWQLLSAPQSRTEFDNLPKMSDRFYDFGLKTISHHHYIITTGDRLKIELQVPEDVIAIAELRQDKREIAGNRVLINRQGQNMVIHVAPPSAGTYDLTIYARKIDDLDSTQYNEVIKYQVAATKAATELPKVYAHFHQHQVSLLEPLKVDLTSNWSTYFNLVVPNAVDVQVINTATQQWTPLNSYGSYFAGNVEIQRGKIAVAARFPGDEQYWQLVEYQARNN